MRDHRPSITDQSLGALWRKIHLRWGPIALGSAVSVVCLWLVFRDVPLDEVLAAFSRADYRFVASAAVLVLLSPLIRAARWRLLFHPDQEGISRVRLAEILLIGQMLNIVMPARVGELARIHFMRRLEGQSRARSLGTIAVEKSLDLVMLCVLAVLIPFFVTLPAWFRDARVSLAAFSAAFFAVALLFPRYQTRLSRLAARLCGPLPGRWPARVALAVERALHSLDVLHDVGINLRLQGWSLLILVASVLTNYLVFQALGLPLPFTAALFLLVVLQIGVAVPSAPGKLGVFHYLCILALGVFGTPRNAAIGYAVLLHAVVFVPPSLLGAVFLWWESVRRCSAEAGETGLTATARACGESLTGRRQDVPLHSAAAIRRNSSMERSPGLVPFSVIVPTHDANSGLEACLAALEQQTIARSAYEIIVVNDGSPARDARAAAERHDALFLIQPQAGAGAARNRGAAHARGAILLFTDADCVPKADWIETMSAPFGDPDVAGVSGTVRTRQAGLVPRYIQLEYDRRYEAIKRRRQIDFISTAAAAYRRGVFEATGGFDASLAGAEDAEFSFRLQRQGYRLVFAPQAVVYHRHPRSVLAYARRKAHYGRWRVTVYGRHPQKAVSDTRTPQAQKLRIALVAVLWIALLVTVLWPPLGWAAAFLALAFLAASLPFWVWTLRRDPWVGLLTPLLLMVGTTGAAIGVTTGILDQLAQRLASRAPVCTSSGLERREPPAAERDGE